MGDSTITIQARCPRCSTVVSWDEDTVTDETMLICAHCGIELETYGEFKERAMEAAREKVRDSLRKALKS